MQAQARGPRQRRVCRFRVRHPLRNMGACAIGQAHDQETLPLVLGAAEQLERQTRARVIGIMNVNFFRSLILSSMSLPRSSGFSPTSASRHGRLRSPLPADHPPGVTCSNRSRTGTRWPKPNRSLSSISAFPGTRYSTRRVCGRQSQACRATAHRGRSSRAVSAHPATGLAGRPIQLPDRPPQPQPRPRSTQDSTQDSV